MNQTKVTRVMRMGLQSVCSNFEFILYPNIPEGASCTLRNRGETCFSACPHASMDNLNVAQTSTMDLNEIHNIFKMICPRTFLWISLQVDWGVISSRVAIEKKWEAESKCTVDTKKNRWHGLEFVLKPVRQPSPPRCRPSTLQLQTCCSIRIWI